MIVPVSVSSTATATAAQRLKNSATHGTTNAKRPQTAAQNKALAAITSSWLINLNLMRLKIQMPRAGLLSTNDHHTNTYKPVVANPKDFGTSPRDRCPVRVSGPVLR